MSEALWIVLGMMLVTYIPRFLPFVMIGDKPLPKKVVRFLEYVPFAALGALIIPGALTAIPGAYMPVAGGLGFAVIYSYLRGGMIVTVVGGIITTYLLLLI